MYKLEIKEEADKIFRKLSKKDKKQLRMINNKIKEIQENPQHTYKFLRNPLQSFNRVHIGNNFVLIFKIDNFREKIVIYYYGNRDDVYKWRPKV